MQHCNNYKFVNIIYLCGFAVGYILGLGDRHVQNILMDRNNAEVVHIDLGKFVPLTAEHSLSDLCDSILI